jgi:hypothetical protein
MVDDRVTGSNFYNTDHALTPTFNYSGGTAGPISIDHNTIHDFANWDTSSDWYHHDGIHCYTSDNGAGPAHLEGLYIYDNHFSEPSGDGSYFTAFIFLEGAGGGTPCDDNTSNNYVFNNVFQDAVGISNGSLGLFSGIDHVYNNTAVGAGPNNGFVLRLGTPASGNELLNNVVSSGNQLVDIESTAFAGNSPNNNVYANGGGNAFHCNGNFYSFGQLAAWQACIGGAGDLSSTAPASAGLNTDGSPQSGSPVEGVGANLSADCAGLLSALCSDINGNPRPSSGAWSAGAFN